MTAAEEATVVVRPATTEDVTAVVALEAAAFTDPWSARSFAGLIGRPEVIFSVLVLRHGVAEEVAGYSVTYLLGEEADLANIAVSAPARRGGLGRRLLRQLMQEARERGVRELYLEVREGNAGARAMYHRDGFSEVGRRAKYYVRPVEDALILRRSL